MFGSSAHACPHCGHVEFARWGRTARGNQRYRSVGRRKTFTSLTAQATVFVHCLASSSQPHDQAPACFVGESGL